MFAHLFNLLNLMNLDLYDLKNDFKSLIWENPRIITILYSISLQLQKEKGHRIPCLNSFFALNGLEGYHQRDFYFNKKIIIFLFSYTEKSIFELFVQ